MAWERRCDRLAVLPRTLAVAGWMIQVIPRCAAPCVRPVEERDGKDLLVQAVLRSPAVARPKTASGHWCLPDDVGSGTIWKVRPVPARTSSCGLQPVVKLSWRRVGVDRLVQRVRYVFAKLRLLMIRAYEAPMGARVPCRQCPQQGRPQAGMGYAAVATMRLWALSGRRATPGRFFLKIWCP